MKDYNYTVTILESEAGGYVAFVPALPGCHTQGRTIPEVKENIKEAISLMLEDMLADGDPIPEIA